MKRLAWHRSWFTVGLGVFLLAFPVLFAVDMSMRRFDPARLVVPIVGIPLCLALIARGLTGSWSKQQLRVDVPAGLLQLATGTVVPLAELGALAITKTSALGMRSSAWHQLRAGDLLLYESPFPADTQRRHDALASAIIQAALRPILERPTAGTAFRAAPEIDDEVIRVAGGSESVARTALAALTSDHDRTVRERAAELLSRGARFAGPR